MNQTTKQEIKNFIAWAAIDGPVTDFTTNPKLAEKWSDNGRTVVELGPVAPTIPVPNHITV